MSSKRFRIAFSFAGEKRVFVARIATIVAKHFGEEKILYDKFHEAEFAKYDLGLRLPKLYGEQSDLIVPVLCPKYDEKRWTGWEWVHIYGLLTKADGDRVMPCRFEHASADGLSPAAGFIELDQKTPQQVANLILERLAINEGKPKNYYTKPRRKREAVSVTSIPNNLPRSQPFFGRETELKKIAESLTPESRGWGALIDGPGGIGKSALAIRAAELVPTERFKRIVFLSSKERELTADGQRALGPFVLPTYLEMLNAIARELEQPELAKSAETERSDAILRVLREADVLLVLDNLETLPATDRDQLFAFLNRLPRGCSAIITSRRRADASAIAVRLDKLDWFAARDLLAELATNNDKLAGTTESERRSLYEETGGNPLLMRWVAGQLGLGRCKTIPAALAFLRSAPAGNNPLEFIFGDLLDTFTPNETKVLAALTHFTTMMATAFIAELAGVNEAAAQGALSDLSSRALVLPDLEEQNFALVPMVADFLRRQRIEIVQETANRLEQRTYALIVENGYDNHERFPLLDDAWLTIAAALPLFLAGANPRLQTVCDALESFFEFTGRWDECVWFNQQAEVRAVAAGDYYNAGWRARDAAYIHLLRHEADAVLSCAERITAHWQKAGVGARERAVASQLRGSGYSLRNDYPAAIAAHREAVELYRHSSPESEDVVAGLNALGDAYRHSGDFIVAKQHLDEALVIARRTAHSESVALSIGNLAALALDQQAWSEAETLSREALGLSEEIGRDALIALDSWRLAKSLVRQNKASDALPYVRRAVEIYTRLDSPLLSQVHALLAECEV